MQKLDEIIMNPNTSDYNRIDAIKAAHMIQKENVLDRQQNRKLNEIREILIGTNNKGKLREIRDLIPKKVKVLSLKNITAKSPNETSKTFKGNALLKARYYSKLTGKICLADDSGLEIDLLNKAPGIYSARWSGKKNNFNLAIKKVFKKINLKDKNWKKRNIKARFKCALSIYGPDFKTVSVFG